MIGFDLVGAIVEAEDIDDLADAFVPIIVHREGGRPRGIKPLHMGRHLGIDPRSTLGCLVRLFIAERPQNDARVIAVAPDHAVELRSGFRIAAVDDRILGELEDVTAEEAEARLDRSLDHAERRHHPDHREDADSDAEHRQQRTKLVRPDGAEGHGEDFGQEHGVSVDQ